MGALILLSEFESHLLQLFFRINGKSFCLNGNSHLMEEMETDASLVRCVVKNTVTALDDRQDFDLHTGLAPNVVI